MWLWLSSSINALSTGSSSNVAIYWGQNSAGGKNTQKPLADYCNDDSTDIILISFLHIFHGTSGLPEVNFSYACEGTYFSDTGLLQCPAIGKDIKTCQGKGKTILLSLGGAAGSYGFSSPDEGTKFADTLWNLFLGGTSETRPFGDAVIDGFDLDIEGGSNLGYVEFVTRLRELFAQDTSKSYYIAAAPQCVIPDHYLDTVIKNADLDFLFVQFYNNYCGMQTWQTNNADPRFNYAAWDTLVKASPNPKTKIYLGVPASESAAGSGYTPITTVLQAASYLQANYDSFGGIMMWDASQAWNNVDSSGNNFAQAAKEGLINGSSDSAENYTPIVSSAVAYYVSSANSAITSPSSSSFKISRSSSLSAPVSSLSVSSSASTPKSTSIKSSITTLTSSLRSTNIQLSSFENSNVFTTLFSPLAVTASSFNAIFTIGQQNVNSLDTSGDPTYSLYSIPPDQAAGQNSQVFSPTTDVTNIPIVTHIATKVVIVTNAPQTVTKTIFPKSTIFVKVEENPTISETAPVTSTITLQKTLTKVVAASTVTTTNFVSVLATSAPRSVFTAVDINKRELSAYGSSSTMEIFDSNALDFISYKTDIQQLNQTHFRGVLVLSSTKSCVPIANNWLVQISEKYKIDRVGNGGQLVRTFKNNNTITNDLVDTELGSGFAIASDNNNPAINTPAMALFISFWGRY